MPYKLRPAPSGPTSGTPLRELAIQVLAAFVAQRSLLARCHQFPVRLDVMFRSDNFAQSSGPAGLVGLLAHTPISGPQGIRPCQRRLGCARGLATFALVI